MSKLSNPQVFPWVKNGETPVTLRDLFAAFALAGALCQETAGEDPPRSIARYAYDLADAMLAAREAADADLR